MGALIAILVFVVIILCFWVYHVEKTLHQFMEEQNDERARQDELNDSVLAYTRVSTYFFKLLSGYDNER